MRRQIKFFGFLLMVAWLSSLAAAVEKPAAEQGVAANELTVGAQDVITASDAGGGHLSDRDILLVVIIVLAVIGLAAIL
jgi:hypothetical protein